MSVFDKKLNIGRDKKLMEKWQKEEQSYTYTVMELVREIL